jgi:hypothetical protein
MRNFVFRLTLVIAAVSPLSGCSDRERAAEASPRSAAMEGAPPHVKERMRMREEYFKARADSANSARR